MKTITKLIILIALAMSTFTACSNNDTDTKTKYIINTLENKDIPFDAAMLAQSEDTKVKITRDVESEMMNVYVISGSVEVIAQ